MKKQLLNNNHCSYITMPSLLQQIPATMVNLKSNSFPFLILLSLQHLFTLQVTSNTFIDNFSLNCGSIKHETSLDNRNWISDTNSKLLTTIEVIEPKNHHSSVTATIPKLPPSVPIVPYSTARLSHAEFTYSFQVTGGQKFLRLYFYPASYPSFHRYNSLFSVKAGHYTLLKDFNASLHKGIFIREYCINVEHGHMLNITFTPSSTTHPEAYAFINGIEVMSVKKALHAHEKTSNKVGHDCRDSKNYNIIDNCRKIRSMRLQLRSRWSCGDNESRNCGRQFRTLISNINLQLVDKNSAGSNPLPPPTSTTAKAPSKTLKKNKPIILPSIIAALSFVVLCIIGFLIFRCVTRAAPRDRNLSSSNTCRQFSIAEIRAATNNFDDGLIVGDGGFGKVYKGYIDKCHTVAVKRLKPESDQGANEFQTEIKMLSQFRHNHLVSLIGYCTDSDEMILVYDFMERGTLRDHLYGSNYPPLTWDKRLDICLAAARGLHFLHDGSNKQSVIHRDVKTTNILLDSDWVAKVSDFGLSKVGPNKSHVTTDVKGSLGYLDPEYYMSLWLTQKSDVYSFGVVLLEVLCGREPIKRMVDKNQESLVVWFKKCYYEGKVDQTVDFSLRGTIRPKCLKKFVEIILSCLDDHGKQRPLMRDVVKGLECALKFQQSGSQGGAFVRGKGKSDEELAMSLTKINVGLEEFDQKFTGVDESSSSKATTTCSEEEQALVRGVFSEVGNPKPR